ncbi:MAG TPA: hypothetical protein VK464_07455 [Symbiobacteriaceae bacterium]|nr:hypothetical protein [Symbiobacteriaceae bacterium]
MTEPERLEMMGLSVPLESDERFADMARCFVEEFARLGYAAEGLLALFRNPFYRGPHMVYQRWGEERVRQLIEQTLDAQEVRRHG